MVKHVAILIYEGCWGLECFCTGPFSYCLPAGKHFGLACHYRVRLVSLTGDSVQSSSGHCLIPDASLNDEADYDLLVIPPMEGARLGVSSVSFQADPTILVALQRTHAHGGRLLAMTTGVFFIAAAGNSPKVPMALTTGLCARAAKSFSQHTFIANQPFLQSERIWTTGTLNGSFDALLEIVALDCGDTFSTALRCSFAGGGSGASTQYSTGYPQPCRPGDLARTGVDRQTLCRSRHPGPNESDRKRI